jgi:hypothetical protein
LIGATSIPALTYSETDRDKRVAVGEQRLAGAPPKPAFNLGGIHDKRPITIFLTADG